MRIQSRTFIFLFILVVNLWVLSSAPDSVLSEENVNILSSGVVESVKILDRPHESHPPAGGMKMIRDIQMKVNKKFGYGLSGSNKKLHNFIVKEMGIQQVVFIQPESDMEKTIQAPIIKTWKKLSISVSILGNAEPNELLDKLIQDFPPFEMKNFPVLVVGLVREHGLLATVMGYVAVRMDVVDFQFRGVPIGTQIQLNKFIYQKNANQQVPGMSAKQRPFDVDDLVMYARYHGWKAFAVGFRGIVNSFSSYVTHMPRQRNRSTKKAWKRFETFTDDFRRLAKKLAKAKIKLFIISAGDPRDLPDVNEMALRDFLLDTGTRLNVFKNDCITGNQLIKRALDANGIIYEAVFSFNPTFEDPSTDWISKAHHLEQVRKYTKLDPEEIAFMSAHLPTLKRAVAQHYICLYMGGSEGFKMSELKAITFLPTIYEDVPEIERIQKFDVNPADPSISDAAHDQSPDDERTPLLGSRRGPTFSKRLRSLYNFLCCHKP